jgi:hypothetical protein
MSKTTYNEALEVKGQMTVGDINITGSSTISGTSEIFTSTDNTAATSSSNGSFRLQGGLSISNTTDAVDWTNGGSITTAGGVAVAKSLWSGTYGVIGSDNQAIVPLSTVQLTVAGNRTAGTNTAGISFQRSGAVISSMGINTGNNFVMSLGNTGSLIIQGSQENFNTAGTSRATFSSSQLNLAYSTNSTSVGTGSFITSGGAGVALDMYIGGTLNVGANVSITGTITSGTWNGGVIGVAYGGTGSTSLTTNAVLLGNGTGAIQSSVMTYTASTLGVLNVNITGTTASTSTSTGALKVAGGVGVAGNIYAAGDVYAGGGNLGVGTYTANAPIQLSNTTGNRKIVLFDSNNNDHQFSGFGLQTTEIRYQVASSASDHVFYAGTGSSTSAELFRVLGTGGIQSMLLRGGSTSGANLTLRSTSNATKGQVYLDETTASTSKTTGALRVAGGVGVEGSLYANNLNVIAATLPQITVGDGDGFGRVLFGNINHGVARGTSIGTLTDSNDVSLWTSGSGRVGLATGTVGDITQRLTIGTTGIVNITATTASTTSGTGALVVAGGLGVAGAINGGSSITLSGDIVMATGSNNIRRNTSDGSDTGYIEITGGGAGGTGRGGRIIVSGNERTTHGGRVQLDAGGTADIQFFTAGTLYGSFSGTDGSMSLLANVASTSSTTGTLKITGGLGVSGNINSGGSVIFNTKLYTTADNSAISVHNDLGLVKKVGEVSKLVAGLGDEVILATSNYNDMRTDAISTGTITDRFKILSTGETRVLSTTGSTSASTGALVVSGGVGVSQNLYVGGNIIGTIAPGIMGQVSLVYVRGTGANNLANRLVRVGQSEHVNTSTVGLTLVIINASDHTLVSATNYDTSTSGTASDNLATALDNLDRQRVGILASYSSFTGAMTANLRTAARRLGLYKLSETTTVSTGYCAVFRGNGTGDPNTNISNQVIESLTDAGATSDYALISTQIVGDSLNVDTLPSVLVSPNPTQTNPAVFVDNNGYVGIGTTDPQRILHTRGEAIRIDRAGDADVIFASYSAGYSSVNKVFRTGVSSTGSNNGTWYVSDLGTATAGAGTTRLSISNSGDVNITATTSSTSTTTGALTVAGGAGIAGDLHVGGDIVLNGPENIRRSTSDGSDNSFIALCGGGGPQHTRGSRIILSGNERVSYGGDLEICGGGSGDIMFFTNGDVLRGSFSGTDGNLTLTNATGSSNLPFLNIENSAGGSGNQVGINLSPFNGKPNPPGVRIVATDGGAANARLGFFTSITDTTPAERMRIDTSGEVILYNTTASTSKTTGALTVAGGAGIAGNAWAGSVSVDSSFPISAQGGHLQWNRSGGGGETYLLNQVGLGGDNAIYLGSSTASNVITNWAKFNGSGLRLYQTTASTSVSTGALVVDGGVGIAGGVYAGAASSFIGDIAVNSADGNSAGFISTTNQASASNRIRIYGSRGSGGITFATNVSSVPTDRMAIAHGGVVSILSGISSTSTTTGSLVVTGGIGASGSVNCTNLKVNASAGLANYLDTNVGNLVSTTNLNPGITVFESTGFAYGMDLGFNGATGRTRIFYPDTAAFAVATHPGSTSPSAQSSFTERLTVSGAGIVNITATTASTSTTTGALKVAGGAGIAGNIISGGYLRAQGAVSGTNSSAGVEIGLSGTSGAIELISSNSTSSPYLDFTYTSTDRRGRILYDLSDERFGIETASGGNRLTIDSTKIAVLPTTASTSTTTGALTVAGGAGIAGDLHVGASINGQSIELIDSTFPLIDFKNSTAEDYDGRIVYTIADDKFSFLTAGTTRMDIAGGSVDIVNGAGLRILDTTGNPGFQVVTDRPNSHECIVVNDWGTSGNPGFSCGTTRTDGTAFQVRNGVTLSSGAPSAVGTQLFAVLGSGLTVIPTGTNITFDPNFRINGPGIDDPGTLTVGISLEVYQNIKTNGVYGNSDERLKRDVVNVRTSMDYGRFITDVDPKMFRWKSDGPNGVLNCGYMAQDLIKRGFPELVIVTSDATIEETVDEDGFVSPSGMKMSINYSNIIPILHENIRDLRQENYELRSQMKYLEDRLLALESKLV